MDEITPQPDPQPDPQSETDQPKPSRPKLSKQERSKIMQEAATRRWANARSATQKTKAVRAAPPKPVAKPVPAQKRPAPPREFSSALKTAEKRLASAILERAKAAATYAVLSAEIPSLQRLIVALRNPLGMVPEYSLPLPPSLEQIVGDQSLAYQNPPLLRPTPVSPAIIPVPQTLHPANTQGRAGGGAVGVELEEMGDENQFLNESGVAGGAWH